ncbi:MAG: hypothetical protein JW776_08230 [Candidatus Lokiarchaeota archaeon]|nr:hypothetical protein [Candidatus Lokiarchaeota archaeon]
MNFDENEIISAAKLGFDLIEGPILKSVVTFVENEINIDYENFLMNFYLSFRGGNSGLKPTAILYDNFYVVAFPRGLELCALFMKPRNIDMKLKRLHEIAEDIIYQMDQKEEMSEDGDLTTISQDYDEIKRIIMNMLSGETLTTPEIRRYFKMTNSEVWKVMSELEEREVIQRTQKVGRAWAWTLNN